MTRSCVEGVCFRSWAGLRRCPDLQQEELVVLEGLVGGALRPLLSLSEMVDELRLALCLSVLEELGLVEQ